MIRRTNFIGYPVDNLNLSDLLNFVETSISADEKHFITVQNANKMYLSKKFPVLKEAIEKSSVILPENAINMGMRWLRRPLKQRNMGGVHIMKELLEYANKNGLSVYLLGASKENLHILIQVINTKYPQIIVQGFRDGYFRSEEERLIAEDIGVKKPNFLFVGMGSPKQELFISRNLSYLNTNIMLGVGGSFNVIAGIEKPAPRWTKYGLEWIYRSFIDPRKFKRYFVINSFFIYRFIRYLIFKL